MINTDWLRAFIAFAEELSFTRAAERLHISQPALHVQIRKLGESLDATLYTRRGKTLALTAEGTKLFALARELQERTETFLAEFQGAAREPTVVLAAGEGALLYLLGDPIRAFQREANARLRILTRSRDRAIEAVQLGEAHFAVTVLDDVPDTLSAAAIARVGSVVLLPKRHRLTRKASVSIRDLGAEPLIVPEAGGPQRESLVRAFDAVGAVWNPVIEARGWELTLHFAELGLGLAIVNDFCRTPPGLITRPLEELAPVTYRLLRLRGRRLPAEARAFEQLVLNPPAGAGSQAARSASPRRR